MDVTASGAGSGVTGSSTFGREPACAEANAGIPHNQHNNTGKNGCNSELGAAANTRAIYAARHLGGGSTPEWSPRNCGEACVGCADHIGHRQAPSPVGCRDGRNTRA